MMEPEALSSWVYWRSDTGVGRVTTALRVKETIQNGTQRDGRDGEPEWR